MAGAVLPVERRRWRSRALTLTVRLLNPRYAWLPRELFQRPVRILDAGCGPSDARNAARLFPSCHFEGINCAPAPSDPARRDAFAAYHVFDLDRRDCPLPATGRFDYVVSSHTLEHLRDGLATARALCDRVAVGGYLYLEWPAPRSLGFPLRGFGLSFFDDPTHRRSYTLEEMVATVEAAGLTVIYAGTRRQAARMLLAPLLVLYHSLKLRRLVLYDLWDFTGFCYVLQATRPGRTSEVVA